ncbi:MAG: hypothetical protein B6I22_12800 [Desulfobacteraceae bacterium 4572_123]|nr:MAG: hypothetical protein B6I22_12800 [Desulfobacteraceae bacterium 4572_123]
MSNASKEYTRLPGKKKNFLIGYYSLWLGYDHLLYIFSRFGIEDYKRFYFKDIQAVITRKTATGKIQNLILSIFCILFSLMALYLKGGWSIFNWSMAGLMAIFLMINWLRGPTCVSHLQTAVQTEKLYSLYRLKTAKKVMNRLRLIIEHEQGKLAREDIIEKGVKAPTLKISPEHTKMPYLPTGQDGMKVHKILFAILIFDGLVTYLDFFYNHVAITLFGTTISMAACVLVIMALVRQHGINLKSSIRMITWTAFVYLCINMFIGYIYYFVVIFRNPKMSHNQWELIKAMSQMSPWDSSMMMGVYIFSICSSLIIGLSGLIISRRG